MSTHWIIILIATTLTSVLLAGEPATEPVTSDNIARIESTLKQARDDYQKAISDAIDQLETERQAAQDHGDRDRTRKIADLIGKLRAPRVKSGAIADADLDSLFTSLNDRTGRWLVLFRSADPSIWNHAVNEGDSRYAISLDKVPDGIQWLKMAMSKDKYVVIGVSKDEIARGQIATGRSRPLLSNRKYLWHADDFDHLAWHLGIVGMDTPDTMPAGSICIFDAMTHPWCGWGFGHFHNVSNQGQGYSWAGRTVPETVFEISVSSSLSDDEENHILK